MNKRDLSVYPRSIEGTLDLSAPVFETLESRLLLSQAPLAYELLETGWGLEGFTEHGEIHGAKWEDLNGDGIWDDGELGIEGWTVFLDDNANTVLDEGERWTTTDAEGKYAFLDLEPGTYIVAEQLQPWWAQTFPDNGLGGSGGVTIFDSENAFLEAHPDVSTETFDEFESGTVVGGPSATVDGVTYTALDPDSVWTAGTFAGSISSPNALFTTSVNDIGDRVLTFAFDGYVQALGFWMMKGPSDSPIPHWDIRVEELDGNVEELHLPFAPRGPWYLGFSSALGIRSLSVVDFAGDTHTTTLAFDNVSHTSIETTLPGTHLVTLQPEEVVEGVNFGNQKVSRGEIQGAKWDDADRDGVWDTDELGLEGWTIFLDANGNGVQNDGEAWTTTGPNGAYSFAGLAPGTYVVREVLQANWAQSFPAGDSHEVEVDPDVVVVGINFGNHLIPGGIQGAKWDDANRDGVWDTDELGLEGWTIFLDANDNGVLNEGEASTTTGVNGAYSFAGLAPGTYVVREVLQTNWAQSFPADSHEIEVLPDVVVGGVNFGNHLIPGGIEGAKWDDADRDGVWDTDELGLEGWTIFLDANDNGVLDDGEASTTTGVNGAYSFAGLAPGTYVVREVLQDDWARSFPAADLHVVEVNPDVVVGGVNFGNHLIPGGIQGAKWDDANRDGVWDDGELGLPGWTIFLDANDNGVLDDGEASTTTTGVNGAYSFAGLAPGSYVVREVLQGDWAQSFPAGDSHEVAVDPDVVTGGVNFGNHLLPGGIHGAKWDDADRDGVWDTDESGLPGWTIFLDANDNGVLNDGEASTTTGVNGVYSFAGLAPGTYVVREVLQANWAQSFPAGGSHLVAVDPDVVVGGVNFGNHLIPGGIQGAKWDDADRDGVWDTDELGLEGWTIFLDANDNGVLDDGEASTTTGVNGAYSFAGLAPGSYVVREVLQANWAQSFPAGDSHVVEVDPDVVVGGVNFGNHLEEFAFADYFPLVPGLVRTYLMRVTPGHARQYSRIIQSVIATDPADVNGIPTYESMQLHGGQHTTSTYYTMDETGLHLHGQSNLAGRAWWETLFAPAFLMVPGMIHVGMVVENTGPWKGDQGASQDWTGTYTQVFEVLGFEQVVTQIGTFNALKVHFMTDASKAGRRVNMSIHDEYSAWLVEGLGVVREEGEWNETRSGKDYSWDFTYEIVAPAGVGAGESSVDLIALFGDRFVIPPIAVPGQRMRVPIVIQNIGEGIAKGKVAVELYASTDQVLDQSDLLIKRQESVNLNLRSGRSRTVYLNTYVPGNVDAGSYFLIAKVDADNVIPEQFETNNIAFTDEASQWVYRFGNIGGRRNAALTVLDKFGTSVTFRLRGNGYGVVDRDETGHLNVTFYGTDTRSSATFRTPRRQDGVINDIHVVRQLVGGGGTIGGSMGRILARTIDLVGDVICSEGWLGYLRLDDIADEHVIVIGENYRPINLYFGSVGDLSIDSAAPINRLTAMEWVDSEDSTPDEIVAPWIGTLRVRGNRRSGILGHFGANLRLSGHGARRNTLRSVIIGGDLYGAQWDITGSMGNLRVTGIVENTTVRTTSSMGTLLLGAVVNSDFLAGIVNSSVRHAASALDFQNPSASIRSVIIRGVKLPGARYFFENSNFSAGSIRVVSLLNLWADNEGVPFGFFALSKSDGGGAISSIRHRDAVTRERWRWRPQDGLLSILDFTAEVLKT